MTALVSSSLPAAPSPSARSPREQAREVPALDHRDAHAVVAEHHEHGRGAADGDPCRLDVADRRRGYERDDQAHEEAHGGQKEVRPRHAAGVLLDVDIGSGELAPEDAAEDEADRATQDDEEDDDEGFWEPDLTRPVDCVLDRQARQRAHRREDETAELDYHASTLSGWRCDSTASAFTSP
jgi:hypothetical protein